MNALEVTNLKKSFGGVRAVDAISFHVEEGETLSIIGPNGAGKTTVFNLITGFYRPDGGSVRFFGKEISTVAPYKLPHMGIARTFQNMRLFGDLTVFENILAPTLKRSGYGMLSTIFRTDRYFRGESKAEEKARRLIDFFELSGKEDYPAKSLPYGEQRRLELARALSTEPRLLLIDEPGAGMNPREVMGLVETLREVKEKFALTLLIIEHQMGLVMNLSDRVMVMDFGEKIMEGPPLEVKKDKRVIEAYLGEDFEEDGSW
jgi:branched-chain amino acid transport system ATP-binding protein